MKSGNHSKGCLVNQRTQVYVSLKQDECHLELIAMIVAPKLAGLKRCKDQNNCRCGAKRVREKLVIHLGTCQQILCQLPLLLLLLSWVKGIHSGRQMIASTRRLGQLRYFSF